MAGSAPWIDLFQETTVVRGYIRARELLGSTTFVTHDAEDAVNWMFRDGPPDDDELPDVRVPPLPAAARRPRSGLPLDTWAAVRWIVSADFPPEGVDALREALAPVLDDLSATSDIGFTLKADPSGAQLDRWSCLILPPGATTIAEARRLEPGEDRFPAWGSVDIRMLDPFPAAVQSAANAVSRTCCPACG